MKLWPGNPSTNVLGAGISEEAVAKAVSSSGYPLQVVVARSLLPDFQLEEEWGYLDSDTSSIRTMDIVASKQLYDIFGEQPRIRPGLKLIIECKQSELPYVFFLGTGHVWTQDFPSVCGLSCDEIVITSDDDPSTWNYSPIGLLELQDHSFLTTDPKFSLTFSKCVRKGKDLELSGSDAYQNLVFPLIKAMEHMKKTEIPPITAYYFDCNVVIGLGVIDAPMISVKVTDEGTELEMTPWVRVVRHQPCEGEHKYDRKQVLAVDIVHKDYFEAYVKTKVLPFAENFAQLALKHAHVLADGKGFVPGMGAESWTDIEARLQRCSLSTKPKRVTAVVKNLCNILAKDRKPSK